MRIRTVITVMVLLTTSMCLVSCTDNKTCPEYLIECGTDNGFVPAWRGYYAIENGNVIKLKQREYDQYVYNDELKHYKYIPCTTYSLHATVGFDISPLGDLFKVNIKI